MAFIESQNTKGSGRRWFLKVETFLQNILKSHEAIPLCKYPPFKEMGFKCIIYKDWVIAFKVEENKCVIRAFVYGGNLNY